MVRPAGLFGAGLKADHQDATGRELTSSGSHAGALAGLRHRTAGRHRYESAHSA
ncbi:hypothetical protein AB5J72_37480 [Streptomyces sp. CG1]|uniref:hypothetical protein n=1 Tax=Streptomyces sp. CG1 TaxID=1287523 RepID=UPI0034E22206